MMVFSEAASKRFLPAKQFYKQFNLSFQNYLAWKPVSVSFESGHMFCILRHYRMTKRLIASLILMGCLNSALADTFTVTSSADNGPGTLREAIRSANANGTATVDYIYFDISQTVFNQRMIRLISELPPLSSNIVIDGTTQPGEKYAITDAKICIRKDDYAPSFSLIKIEDAEHVKLFGLYLYYGYWQGLFGNPFRSKQLYGVNIANSNDIEIGAPGKGNVINGVVHGIYSNRETCSDIVIRSNFIGHGKYYVNSNSDIDNTVLGVECCITLASVRNITIGGNQPEDGNVFGSAMRGINIDSKNSSGNGFIKLQNNYLGRGWDKKTLINVYDFWDAYINIGRSRNNPLNWTLEHQIDYRIELYDNDISNHIRITYVSDSIIAQRNHFEEDQRTSTGMSVKFVIAYGTGGGLIGGEDAADANFFKNKKPDTYFGSLAIYESGPISILKNIFDCNSGLGSTTSVEHYIPIPFAQVDVTTAASAEGRATPNARVDLYYDDECTACEGKIYLDHVTADASGKWKYIGAIKGTIVATATLKGYTSQFSMPLFDWNKRVIKHPTCGKNNGSITGITSQGAEAFFWMNLRTKDTVSHTIELLDAGPGEYLLYGVHGGTCINTLGQSITLEDQTPQIRTDWTTVQQPSCGKFNGYIGTITVFNGQSANYKWTTSQGQTISDKLYVNSLGPGTYYFIITDTTLRGGCSDTAKFIMTNLSGPSVLTDNMNIAAASCEGDNGSITGITTSNVTGTPFIQWINANNTIVGDKLDLLNVPAGQYRLKFKDGGACDTIVTSSYTILNKGGISIDSSNKIIAPSKCSTNTGSIRNLDISGGETYQWKAVGENTILATTKDIYDLPPGQYQLTVKNSLGCSKSSGVFSVPQSSFIPISVGVGYKAASCGKANGSLGVHSSSGDLNTYKFKWIDSSTKQVVTTGLYLFDVNAGTYYLSATDSNGCEAEVYKGSIESLPIPSFDYGKMQVQPDVCLSGEGSIKGLTVKDMQGTARYAWYNSLNDSIGNSLDIQNLSEGAYYVKATDLLNCSVTSQLLTIVNHNEVLPPPRCDDQTTLKNTTAILQVKNVQQGVYELFEDASGANLLQRNNTGVFTTPPLSSERIYYMRLTKGVCSSELVPIKIMIVDKTAIYVPSAFTPNGDGKNDRLKPIAFGKVTLKHFTIYNRWGQVVFSTTNRNKEWDGTLNGRPLDTGVYVWFVRAVDELRQKTIEEKGTVLIPIRL